MIYDNVHTYIKKINKLFYWRQKYKSRTAQHFSKWYSKRTTDMKDEKQDKKKLRD